MKKQSHSAGFGVVEIILIVVVVGLLAFLGYYVYTQQNKPAPNQNTQQTASNTAEQPAQTTTEGSVEIKEWGVKVALRDYDKVAFTVSNESGPMADGTYQHDGVAKLTVKPQFLKNKDCTPGLSLYRSKTGFTQENMGKKIGDYYYTITGGPGRCSDDPQNDPDDLLMDRIRQDFTVENTTKL